MKVQIAFNIAKTRKLSFQNEFPKEIDCCYCSGKARMGFVAHEMDEPTQQKGGKYVCQLHKNEHAQRKFWLHDACCVAVYFCKKCLEPTALYNQA